MKYIFLIICYIILSVFSLKKTRPKLCINCKFFVNNLNDNKYGKCSFFPIEENNTNFLVIGFENIDYYYCSTARNYDNMCGKEGKKYKNKPSKKEHLK